MKPGFPRTQDGWISTIVAVVAGVAALPLIVGQPAALQDWPNHVARAQILDGMLHGDAFWLAHYHFNAWLMTNFAMDLAIQGIHHFGLSIAASATIFLLATYACFVGGFTYLAIKFGGTSADPLKPLFAVILFYTAPLMLGLVDYVLGLGIAFWSWGLWLGARNSVCRRSVIGVTAVVLICACHVAAACVFVLVLASLKLAEARGVAMLRASLSATTILPGIVLLIFIVEIIVVGHHENQGDRLAISYAGSPSPVGIAREQMRMLAHVLVDGIGWSGLVATISGIGAFMFMVVAGARVRLPRAPAIAACISLAVALALPTKVGLAGRVAYRIAIVPAIIAAAGAEFIWRKPMWRIASGAALAGVTLTRTAMLTGLALQSNAAFGELTADAAALPAGSTLVTELGRQFKQIPWSDYWSPALEELATVEVTRPMFLPSVFAFRSQQPIVMDTQYDALRRPEVIQDEYSYKKLQTALGPFCHTKDAAPSKPPIFLLFVYPGAYITNAVPATAVLARNHHYQLTDACAVAAQGP